MSADVIAPSAVMASAEGAAAASAMSSSHEVPLQRETTSELSQSIKMDTENDGEKRADASSAGAVTNNAFDNFRRYTDAIMSGVCCGGLVRVDVNTAGVPHTPLDGIISGLSASWTTDYGAEFGSWDLRSYFPPMQHVVVENMEFNQCSIADFWNEYLQDDAPRSMKQFHLDRGDENVIFGKWQPISLAKKPSFLGDLPHHIPKYVTLERKIQFRTPIKIPVGPKATNVSIVQRIIRISEQYFVMESTMKLVDVPYADRFRIVTRKKMEASYTTKSSPRSDDQQYSPTDLMNSSFCSLGQNPFKGASSPLIPTLILTVEFEVQFLRRCNFEDRIKSSLTKKISKLLGSWCRRTKEEWTEMKYTLSSSWSSSSSPDEQGEETPLQKNTKRKNRSTATTTNDVNNINENDSSLGEDDDGNNGTHKIERQRSDELSPPMKKKWQPLMVSSFDEEDQGTVTSDKSLLWFMSDDEDDNEDDERHVRSRSKRHQHNISDSGDTSQEFHLLEWKQFCLSEMESESGNIYSLNSFVDSGCGVEVCQTFEGEGSGLVVNEESTSPMVQYDSGASSHQHLRDLAKVGLTSRTSCAPRCDVEVVYVTDEEEEEVGEVHMVNTNDLSPSVSFGMSNPEEPSSVQGGNVTMNGILTPRSKSPKTRRGISPRLRRPHGRRYFRLRRSAKIASAKTSGKVEI